MTHLRQLPPEEPPVIHRDVALTVVWSSRIALIGLMPLAAGVIGRATGYFGPVTAGALDGLGLVCAAGLVPKRLLDAVAPPPACPSGIDKAIWDALLSRTDAGYAIGTAERLLILVASWMQSPTLIGAWLAFKLASKWETWKNVVQVPDALDGVNSTDWLIARNDLGSWLLNRFWLGTLYSVLAGLAAAYVGMRLGVLTQW
jgi:hypothetical protein